MSKDQAIVIGSGFGGLAAAIRLQAAGIPTLLLEKRDLPGGRAYVYKEQGFTFDAGPTVVTAPNCVEELFDIAKRPMKEYVELLPVAPMYRLCWESGNRFDYTESIPETIAQIKAKAPQDAQRYPEFLEYTKKVFEEGYTKLAHVPFLSFWDMVKVSPQLLQLSAYRTVYSMVTKYIKDPELAQAFSFHSLLVGGNPFSASSIYTLIHALEKEWGVFFPRGGMGALVSGLAKLFQDLGGEFRLSSEVDSIETKNSKVLGVKLKSGEFLPANLVVSNADVFHSYHKLLRKESLLDGKRRQLERSRFSMSLFLLYFGTKRKFNELPHHSVLFGARYKELLKDIFHRGVLADDFSLYLHHPTVTDPTLAPEGCDAFYALSPVPHLGKGEIDWKTEGPKYANRILSYLDQHYLPGLKREIIVQRTFTPLDFESELNARYGSAFSLEPVLWQSAYFRTANRDPRIQGLYFVGAGTHPGAGLPGVIGSAKATAGLVLEDVQNKREIASSLSGLAMTKSEANLQALCQTKIEVGSKSFSMASKLFGEEMKRSAHFLYSWCRHCDDAMDECTDPKEQTRRLEALIDQTRKAFRNGEVSDPEFIALKEIAQRYSIPLYYAEELLEGMAMDLRRETYNTVEDLIVYCYRVAGTVGLMMSHVMGISEEQALKNAADMGIAMQLTNISRDILEDAQMGRVYLPKEWLEHAGIKPEEVSDRKNRKAVAGIVAELLELADGFYRSGSRGLKYLPWRAAVAVAAASRIYSTIGRRVRARGEFAWESRTTVSKLRKAFAVVEGLVLVALTIPHRLLFPFRRVQLKSILSHQLKLEPT